MCSFGIPVGSSRIVLNLIFALLNSLSDSNLVPFTPKTALIRLALKALFLVTGISTSFAISDTRLPIYGANRSCNNCNVVLLLSSSTLNSDGINCLSITRRAKADM